MKPIPQTSLSAAPRGSKISPPGYPALTRRAITLPPLNGAQNSARCARGIWEEERLPPW